MRVSLLLFLLVSTSTAAAVPNPLSAPACIHDTTPPPQRILIVDKDQCGGKIYCTIQAAVNAAGPGTAVRIRQASTPYNEAVRVTSSGTVGQPLVIEAAPDHHPILTGGTQAPQFYGALSVQDADHVVVRNLTFDGFNQPSAANAIVVRAQERSPTNIVISHNTIRNWIWRDPLTGERLDYGERQAGIFFLRSWPQNLRESVARCNTLDHVAGAGIKINGTGALIEYNTITNMQCGWYSNKSARKKNVTYAVAFDVTNTSGNGKGPGGANEQGHYPDLVIRNNLSNGIAGCPFPSTFHYSGGFWCDVGAAGGQFTDNVILNAVGGGAEGGAGVHIESRCHNWRVANNLVILSTPLPYAAAYRARKTDGTMFENNIACGGDVAFWVLGEKGNTVTIRGNTVYGVRRRLLGGKGDREVTINGTPLTQNFLDNTMEDRVFTTANMSRSHADCPETGAPQGPSLDAPALGRETQPELPHAPAMP